jgi:hypothetical protein
MGPIYLPPPPIMSRPTCQPSLGSPVCVATHCAADTALLASNAYCRCPLLRCHTPPPLSARPQALGRHAYAPLLLLSIIPRF